MKEEYDSKYEAFKSMKNILKADKVVNKSQAEHLIKNCDNIIVHSINKVNIYNLNACFIQVNTESVHCNVFETLEEAIDHTLDFYKMTKNVNQGNLNLNQ